MRGKSWVCSTCSQDFTRKHSAHRHNRVLHQGQGKILRILDYIVERIGSQYSPADPLTYRPKRKQYKQNLFARNDPFNADSFPFRSLAHHIPDSQSNESIAEYTKYKPDSSQRIPAQQSSNEPELNAFAEHNDRLASKFRDQEIVSTLLSPTIRRQCAK